MRHKLTSLSALALVGLLTSPAAAAPDKPTADEVKKVFAYFNEGKGSGPVLLELEPCLKVGHEEGKPKKTCVEPITDPVPPKTTVFAFTRYFVPADDTYEITFEWLHDGKERAAKTASVSTGYAYGTWKGSTLHEPGEHTIRIKVGDEVLGTTKVTVAASE